MASDGEEIDVQSFKKGALESSTPLPKSKGKHNRSGSTVTEPGHDHDGSISSMPKVVKRKRGRPPKNVSVREDLTPSVEDALEKSTNKNENSINTGLKESSNTKVDLITSKGGNSAGTKAQGRRTDVSKSNQIQDEAENSERPSANDPCNITFIPNSPVGGAVEADRIPVSESSSSVKKKRGRPSKKSTDKESLPRDTKSMNNDRKEDNSVYTDVVNDHMASTKKRGRSRKSSKTFNKQNDSLVENRTNDLSDDSDNTSKTSSERKSLPKKPKKYADEFTMSRSSVKRKRQDSPDDFKIVKRKRSSLHRYRSSDDDDDNHEDDDDVNLNDSIPVKRSSRRGRGRGRGRGHLSSKSPNESIDVTTSSSVRKSSRSRTSTKSLVDYNTSEMSEDENVSDSDTAVKKDVGTSSARKRGKSKIRKSLDETDQSKIEDDEICEKESVDSSDDDSEIVTNEKGRGRGRDRGRKTSPRVADTKSEDGEDDDDFVTKTPRARGRGRGTARGRGKGTPKGRGKGTPKGRGTEREAESEEEAESYKCMKCEACFNSKSGIKEHMMRHHYAVWTVDCPEGLTDRSSLILIMKRIGHLLCPSCGKVLKFMSYYDKHVKWCGRESETFICEKCKHSIKLMWQREHERMHIKQEEMQAAQEEKEAAKKMEEKRSSENKEYSSRGSVKRGAAKKAKKLLQDISTKDGLTPGDDDRDTDAVIDDESSSDDNDDDEGDEEVEESEDGIEEEESEKKQKKIVHHVKSKPTVNLGVYFKTNFDTNVKIEEQLNKHTEVKFPEFLPRRSNWIAKDIKTMTDYVPQTEHSVEFVIRPSPNSKKSDTRSLKMFSSIVTQGPVWGLSWCPTPSNRTTPQYLAVACNLDMDKTHPSSEAIAMPGLIQIWKFQNIHHKSQKPVEPSLVMCVAHDNGMVREINWCPSLCWQDPANDQPGGLPLLGVLAAACSDGRVQIYSIPHPDLLLPTDRDNDDPVFYKPDPTVSLVRHHQHQEKASPCLCVAWQPQATSYSVMAGYGDGTVSLYDLKSKSPLLKITTPDGSTCLFPYKSRRLHQSAVMCCTWSPHCPYFIVTGSFDRESKLWDTRYLEKPIEKESGSTVLSVEWPRIFTGYLLSQDDAFIWQHCFVKLVPYGCPLPDIRCSSTGFVPMAATAWMSSMSNWLTQLMCVDNIGTATGILFPKMLYAPNYKPKRWLVHLYTTNLKKKKNPLASEKSSRAESKSPPSETRIKSKESEPVIGQNSQQPDVSTDVTGQNVSDSVDKSKDVQNGAGNHGDKKTIHKISYEDINKDMYLEYTDNLVVDRVKEEIAQEDVGNFPLRALYRIQYNPNPHCCTWIATAGQAGIVRIHNMFKLQNTRIKHTLENYQTKG